MWPSRRHLSLSGGHPWDACSLLQLGPCPFPALCCPFSGAILSAGGHGFSFGPAERCGTRHLFPRPSRLFVPRRGTFKSFAGSSFLFPSRASELCSNSLGDGTLHRRSGALLGALGLFLCFYCDRCFSRSASGGDYVFYIRLRSAISGWACFFRSRHVAPLSTFVLRGPGRGGFDSSRFVARAPAGRYRSLGRCLGFIICPGFSLRVGCLVPDVDASRLSSRFSPSVLGVFSGVPRADGSCAYVRSGRASPPSTPG